jgi:uncharacterized RDD family membrane protein YckC
MFCIQCGAARAAEARWCVQCGSLLAEPAMAATAPPPRAAPPAPMAPYAPPQPARPTLASFGARLGSRLIDTVVAGGVAVVVALVALAIYLLVDSALYISGGGGLIQPWNLLVLLLLSWLIAVPIIRIGGEGNRPGQTLGKAAAGIRVVRADEEGSRAGYGPAFGRFFLNLVPVLSLLTCLSMLWSQDGRCWHDAWTGTRVEKSPVPERARGHRWNPAILAACCCIAFTLAVVGVIVVVAVAVT